VRGASLESLTDNYQNSCLGLAFAGILFTASTVKEIGLNPIHQGGEVAGPTGLGYPRPFAR